MGCGLVVSGEWGGGNYKGGGIKTGKRGAVWVSGKDYEVTGEMRREAVVAPKRLDEANRIQSQNETSSFTSIRENTTHILRLNTTSFVQEHQQPHAIKRTVRGIPYKKTFCLV